MAIFFLLTWSDIRPDCYSAGDAYSAEYHQDAGCFHGSKASIICHRYDMIHNNVANKPSRGEPYKQQHPEISICQTLSYRELSVYDCCLPVFKAGLAGCAAVRLSMDSF